MDTIKKVINELKLTQWPTLGQLLRLTAYTVILCAIIALIISGFDILLQWGLAQFLKLEL